MHLTYEMVYCFFFRRVRLLELFENSRYIKVIGYVDKLLRILPSEFVEFAKKTFCWWNFSCTCAIHYTFLHHSTGLKRRICSDYAARRRVLQSNQSKIKKSIEIVFLNSQSQTQANIFSEWLLREARLPAPYTNSIEIFKTFYLTKRKLRENRQARTHR